MGSPDLTHQRHILTNSFLRFGAENVKDLRKPSVIRGSSKLGGGDFVVIIPDEGSVSTSADRFCVCCSEFINSRTDRSFPLIFFLEFHLESSLVLSRLTVDLGALSSVLELDKDMISSSTKSFSLLDDCSVCNNDNELLLCSWSVCFEDVAAKSFASNLYHSGLQGNRDNTY